MSTSPTYHVSKTDRQEPLDMAHLDTGLSDGDDARSERPAACTDAQLSPQLVCHVLPRQASLMRVLATFACRHFCA